MTKKYLQLTPHKGEFPRPVPRSTQKHYRLEAEIRTMLTPFVTTSDHKIAVGRRRYFMIEFGDYYTSNDAQKALKFFKARQERVLSDFSVIASVDQDDVLRWTEGTIFKYVRGVVKGVSEVTDNSKIGKSLVEQLESIPTGSELEVTILLYEGGSTLISDIISRIKELDSACSVISTYDEIRALSVRTKIPCITTISEWEDVQKVFGTALTQDRQSNFAFFPVEGTTKLNTTYPTATATIVDTGVNFSVLNLRGKSSDKDGHGTAVAALVAFGDTLRLEEAVQTVEVHEINTKIGENNDIVGGVLQSLRESKDGSVICMAQNAWEMDFGLRRSLSERLDRIVQSKNVLFINSAGNIGNDDVLDNASDENVHVRNFDVFFPAEMRQSLVIGCAEVSEKTPAADTRYGINPAFVERARDEFLYLKPEICVTGAYATARERRQAATPEHMLISINHEGKRVGVIGSSYATAIMTNIAAKLVNRIKNRFRNSETWKAILINRSKLEYFPSRGNDRWPLFVTRPTDNPEQISDGIYLGFEGKIKPSQQFIHRNKHNYVIGEEVKFYVPKGIKSVRIVLCHSNDSAWQRIDAPAVAFVTKITTARHNKKSKYSTFAKPTHTHYGEYQVRAEDEEQEWTLTLKAWSYRVPEDEKEQVQVRYGISIKLIPRQISELDKLYDIIESKLGISSDTEKTPVEHLTEVSDTPTPA